ncbi:hypothetical protein [Terrihabitans sp. B22-R8]|uniref:hypothetical protein n=1 Tax=Terrihabitans sp. B22-R8 TaxID=3425128 RepID=UPI00403C2446
MTNIIAFPREHHLIIARFEAADRKSGDRFRVVEVYADQTWDNRSTTLWSLDEADAVIRSLAAAESLPFKPAAVRFGIWSAEDEA